MATEMSHQKTICVWWLYQWGHELKPQHHDATEEMHWAHHHKDETSVPTVSKLRRLIIEREAEICKQGYWVLCSVGCLNKAAYDS